MNFYDLAYSAALAVAAPLWLSKSAARKKVVRAFDTRMGQVAARTDDAPAILIHAVSLGEVNATRALVEALERSRADLRFIVSATTDTGFHRAMELYGKHPRVSVIRYPLDFSWAIDRVLDRLRPSAVALMELEVWPNFLRQCRRRNIPVVLLNGRLTEKSFRNYRRGRPLVRGMFRGLARVCAQEAQYAQRFIELGAAANRVEVTGTMKFDTAPVGDRVEGDVELADAVGLHLNREPVWVCGSTGPGEETIVLDAYARLLEKFPKLRLVISPRKPERFDEVARLIQSRGFGLIRRSESLSVVRCPLSEKKNANHGPRTTDHGPRIIILGDTMGELRKFYSLATVVFVGRTLLDLGASQHGSDMIEPAALGKPVVVGPYTGNFAEPMRQFRAAHALVEIARPDMLMTAIENLLRDTALAATLSRAGQQVVRQHRGATARHAEVLLDLL
jgi:3-deoxy-D-manno-octulosonic-acid transferase